MIYTIGHRTFGVEVAHVGCYAFLTFDDAVHRIKEKDDPTYVVFGMEADWEEDTSPSSDGWWHYLTRDAPIIPLWQGIWLYDNAPFKRFQLHRLQDVSGVSGTGMVAEGVQFTDGTVVLRWVGEHPSTVIWENLEYAMVVHGHDGKTRVEWVD